MDHRPERKADDVPTTGGATTRAVSHGRRVLVDRLRRGSLAFGIAAAMLGVCAVAQTFVWLFGDLPALPPAEKALAWNREPGILFLNRDGRPVATRGPRYGVRVELADLPGYVPLAFMAAEDRRFRRHGGVDLRAVLRAAAANLRAGRTVEGGSTLTQQLAREMLLGRERTLRRKLQEAVLAARLEDRFGKDGVLELYLNRVYLGRGAYGVEAAARAWFGKSAPALTLREAAWLAALANAPSGLDPARAPGAAERRTRLVLERMAAEGWIGEARLAATLSAPLRLTPRSAEEGTAGWLFDLAAAEAKARVGPDAPNLVVRTTLDPEAQSAAEQALAATFAPEDGSEAALVALAPDGAVRALIGGRRRTPGATNAATVVRRAPDATSRPLLRALGGDAPGGTALQKASLASAGATGAPAAALKRVGLIAGGRETRGSLMQLASAWQALQSEGLRSPAYLVSEIETTDGRVVWRRTPPTPTRVFGPVRREIASAGAARSAGGEGVWVGFTPDWTAATWVGDQAAEIADTDAAAALWRAFVDRAPAEREGAGAAEPRLVAMVRRRAFYAALETDFAQAADSAPR